MEPFVVAMSNCASCGEDHEYLLAASLELPEEENGYVYTHLCICPNTGDEILISVDELEEI